MSRQIRRQIPQKQKKKRVDRNACLLVQTATTQRTSIEVKCSVTAHSAGFPSADSER